MTTTEAQKPLVSIIMNCLDSEEFLLEALQSVMRQSYQNWEIIFWDNGSIDKSAAIVKGLNDSRIKYFYRSHTEPLGAARNHALREASGVFITFLDCDDLWLESKLERQVEFFTDNDEIGFLYGNFISLRNADREVVYSPDKQLPEGNVTGELLVRYRLNLQTVMLRRHLLEKVGDWFDTRLQLCEEMELFLRMSTMANFAYIAEPLVLYRVHERQFTVKKFDQFYEEREYIINKLCDTIAGFSDSYTSQISSFRATMALDKSSDLILRGEKQQAAFALKEYRFRELKVFLVWVLCFFPVSIFLAMNKLAGRAFMEERYRYLQQNKNL